VHGPTSPSIINFISIFTFSHLLFDHHRPVTCRDSISFTALTSPSTTTNMANMQVQKTRTKQPTTETVMTQTQSLEVVQTLLLGSVRRSCSPV
jgi:hypothetical protein